MRRALGLVELLVVVAILGILAAVLFPVFARSKERAKLTSCASRLRQLAVALNLYRADNDGLGYRWTHDPDHPVALHFPYNSFEPMRDYLEDGKILWCPLASKQPGEIDNAYLYRTWSPDRDGNSVQRHLALKPVSGSVLVFCTNHTQEDLENATAQRGSIPFVREDTSLGIAQAKSILIAYYSSAKWYDTYAPERALMYRFPGEPWPPEPEG